MRDVVAAEGVAAFRSAVADLIINDEPVRSQRRSNDAVGIYPLRDGAFAYGVGLAFGHADATSLQRLTEAAEAAGAGGLRAAPGRALMVVGLTQQTASSFAAAAEALGFVVRAGDPRRHVVACAGAPICASADIAARALAPQIAAAAAPHLDGSFKIHISGCAKGCAHPAPAALTIVGTSSGCALVANGSTGDAPFKIVGTNELPAAVAEIARGIKHENDHV
jgi:precorrin-3B synthase